MAWVRLTADLGACSKRGFANAAISLEFRRFWVINRCVFTVGKTRGQVKESDIHASYKDGTLCLQVPKAEAQPQVESKHQIAIED